ncbi:pteridine reductase [Legionella gresilensis]|uniref:pteridine reductase n=1 Tax=Legionella gresilensis TaxID=91823 RepID=UPI00104190D6
MNSLLICLVKTRKHTLIYDNKQVNEVALVTGAARRIGAAIAQQLHQVGFNVAIHCQHSLNEAQLLANFLNKIRPESAHVFQADLNQPHECKDLIKQVLQWGSKLNMLVNNASVFKKTNVNEVNLDDWQTLFTVNVQAPFLLSLVAFPHLSLQQGAIINITDIHADKPLRDYAVYCQTKAALAMQTKVLAKEFAPHVRVNAVAPGAIVWPEKENALNLKVQEHIISNTLLKRHGDPRFIAQAVVSLINNPFITGQILNVDGGRSIS